MRAHFLLLIALVLSARAVVAQSYAAATLGSVSPSGVLRGATMALTLSGSRLHDATGVFFDDDAIVGQLLPPAANRNQLRIETTIGSTARLGIHRVFVQTPHGTTNAVTFTVGDWPAVAEQPGNGSALTAQRVTLPCTVTGTLTSPGDADHFVFEGRRGQEFVAEVVASQLRSRLNSVLTLFDEQGRIVAENNDYDHRPDSLLAVRLERDGRYVLRLRDFENQSGNDVSYRLNLGEFPLVTSVFPLGLQRGTTAQFTLTGFNLKQTTVSFTAPADGAGKTITLPVESLHPAQVAVREFREALAPAKIAGPMIVNDRIAHGHPGYRFTARRQQRIVFEIEARRLGSPLDSVIEILDSTGRLVPRATLRPVAETVMVLNDRDSVATGLRLLSWNDLAINDYVYVGGEVIQVLQLPLGPDEDVRFRSLRGARQTLLDTTPVAHAMNSSVYKVQVHSPERTFPPNGMPLFTVHYRNDDGGSPLGKDSRLTFTAPADGAYVVRISDARGQVSDRYSFRLTMREPVPGYRLTMGPEHPNVPRGGSAVVTFTADRIDGFDGEIRLQLDGLPGGWHATEGIIQAGEATGNVVLYAADDAATAAGRLAFQVTGTAVINGQVATQRLEAERGVRLLTALPRPDVMVTTDRTQVVIQPGREVTLTARIERHNKFAGRVPVEVRNLPHGVRVLDVGLNGVLITEQQQSRQFVLYCEPWVKPLTWTFFVGGKVEGGVDNFAQPVTLTVAAK